MFSVQLLYKSSVQKIKLNQNEFPMKHTQVKQLFNHTIIMEKSLLNIVPHLKHNTKYTSYYIVLDKTSTLQNRAYNVFKIYITQLSNSLCKWWPFILCIRSQSLNLLGKLHHQKLVIPVEHNSIQILSIPINNAWLQNNKTNYQKSWHIKKRMHNKPKTEIEKLNKKPTSLFRMFSTIFSPS